MCMYTLPLKSPLFLALIIGFSPLIYATDSGSLSPLGSTPGSMGYTLAAGQIAAPWGNTPSYGLHMPTPGGQHCSTNTDAFVQIAITLASAYSGEIHYVQATYNNPPLATADGYYTWISRLWVDSDDSGANVGFNWSLHCIPKGAASAYMTPGA